MTNVSLCYRPIPPQQQRTLQGERGLGVEMLQDWLIARGVELRQWFFFTEVERILVRTVRRILLDGDFDLRRKALAGRGWAFLPVFKFWLLDRVDEKAFGRDVTLDFDTKEQRRQFVKKLLLLQTIRGCVGALNFFLALFYIAVFSLMVLDYERGNCEPITPTFGYTKEELRRKRYVRGFGVCGQEGSLGGGVVGTSRGGWGGSYYSRVGYLWGVVWLELCPERESRGVCPGEMRVGRSCCCIVWGLFPSRTGE